MAKRNLALLFGLVVILAACEQSYEAQVDDMKDYFRKSKIGNGSDAVLVKSSSLGISEVGVLFGYADDLAGCQDIADLLNDKYSPVTYFCYPLN